MAELNGTNIQGNLTINGIDIFLLIYPVGSVYISTNSTNPSSLFGGTWVAWGSGRVPVGINTSDTNFNTVEKTGGGATHTHTQSATGAASGNTGSTTLAQSQIPNYNIGFLPAVVPAGHGNYTNGGVISSSTPLEGRQSAGSVYGSVDPQWGWTLKTNGGGGGHSHTLNSHTHTNPTTNSSSSLQPYITCYMWKRTA